MFKMLNPRRQKKAIRKELALKERATRRIQKEPRPIGT